MPVESPPKKRVLVVDDDHDQRLILSGFMARSGFHVDAVADGAMALALVGAQPPDIVLLDAMLPRMDGFEICRAIRSVPRSRHIPVIIITGQIATAEARAESNAVGANAFLEKPLRLAEVLAIVHGLLGDADGAPGIAESGGR
jgi:DNA-binding response OmpR family regulator